MLTRFEHGPGNPIPEAEQIIDKPKKLSSRRQEPELALALILPGCHPAESCQVQLQKDEISGLRQTTAKVAVLQAEEIEATTPQSVDGGSKTY